MKCPACVENGDKSILFEKHLKEPPEGGLVERFYDYDGRKHVHAHTVHRMVLQCSNGHAYQQRLQERCPCTGCGWNEKSTVKARDLPIDAPPAPNTEETNGREQAH